MLSPCIKKCKLNSQNICMGCGRTIEMIKNWINLSEEEKRRIISKLKKLS